MADQPSSPMPASQAQQQDEAFERLDRFHSLAAGEYWRATRDIEDIGVRAGDVLLIQSLNCVDDRVHNVVLYGHPRRQKGSWKRTHRMLVDDFVATFEYEPEGKAVRDQEIAAIQDEVQALQRDLVVTQKNRPLLLQKAEEEFGHEIEQGAPQGVTDLPAIAHKMERVELGGALAQGVTEDQVRSLQAVAQQEHRTAKLASRWLTSRTKKISETLSQLTPFYEEQAVAALAQTEDVQRYVADLHKGIESLYLYTGKDVEVVPIKKGASAPINEPLCIFQKKLMVDEELCLYADLDADFDWRSMGVFLDHLGAHPEFVDQLIPTPRGVVCIATTRRYINYGKDQFANAINNRRNQEVFLLVRDGENLYQVYSPVESHLGSHRLFPTKAEIDALYKKKFSFSGIDCERVTFRDVTYTDSLAAHEAAALHYRRFLILLAGLDARLKLLGEFYPSPEHPRFISQAFQEKYFRFVEDDDAAQLLEDEACRAMPSLSTWVAQKNAGLMSGSRVMCYWHALLDIETAPGVFTPGGLHCDPSLQYEPEARFGIMIAQRDGADIVVRPRVAGKTTQGEDREFSARVALNRHEDGHGAVFGFLCLDAVRIEEVDHYLNHREARVNQIAYIKLFKRIRAYLVAEREAEADTRSRLAQALVDGGLATRELASQLVDEAVTTWRAAHRGAALPCFSRTEGVPKEWQALLDHLFRVAQKDDTEAVAKAVTETGRRPLRLVVDGKGITQVYASPLPDERDDRLLNDQFVVVLPVATRRSGRVTLGKPRRKPLLPTSTKETVKHEWNAAAEYVLDGELVWSTPGAKDRFLGPVERAKQAFVALRERPVGELLEEWNRIRRRANESGNFVKELEMALPFAAVLMNHRGKLVPRHVYASVYCPSTWLGLRTDDMALRQRVRSAHASRYASPVWRLEGFDKAMSSRHPAGYWAVRVGEPNKSGSWFTGRSLPSTRGGRFVSVVHRIFENKTLEEHPVWLAPGLQCPSDLFSWLGDDFEALQQCVLEQWGLHERENEQGIRVAILHESGGAALKDLKKAFPHRYSISGPVSSEAFDSRELAEKVIAQREKAGEYQADARLREGLGKEHVWRVVSAKNEDQLG